MYQEPEAHRLPAGPGDHVDHSYCNDADEVETAMRDMFDETHSSSTTNSTYLKGRCSHVTSLDNGEEATVLLFEDDDDYDFPGTIGTNNNNVDDEVYQFKDLDDN